MSSNEGKSEGGDKQPKRPRFTASKASARVDEKRSKTLNDAATEFAKKKRRAGERLPQGALQRAFEEYMLDVDHFPDCNIGKFTYAVKRSTDTLSFLNFDDEEECEEREEEAAVSKMVTVDGEEKGEGGGAGAEELKKLDDTEYQRRRGGRPTNKSTEEEEAEGQKLENDRFTCRNWIVEEIQRRDGLGEDFFHAEVIREGEIKFNLPSGTILASTISKRLFGGGAKFADKPGPKGFLEGPIEETLADLLVKFAKHGFPLNKEEILALANLLVKGTEIDTNICRAPAPRLADDLQGSHRRDA